MDERYAEVLGRLLINAKTTTTSRVVPTSKSTIQSNTRSVVYSVNCIRRC